MLHSTQLGLYTIFSAWGSRGCESDGTTIMNRSIYIPMFTEIEAMTVPRMVRVFLLERIATGMMKQVANMVQKWGANFPLIFIQKMPMCAGSLP